MEFFEIEDKSGIRTIRFNNIRKKNALNKRAYIKLGDILNKASSDDSIKCVVLTGKGDFFRYTFGLCSCCYHKIIDTLILVQETILLKPLSHPQTGVQ